MWVDNQFDAIVYSNLNRERSYQRRWRWKNGESNFSSKRDYRAEKSRVFQRTPPVSSVILEVSLFRENPVASTSDTSRDALVALSSRRKIDKTQKRWKLLTIFLRKSQIKGFASTKWNFSLLCSSNQTLLITVLLRQLLVDLCTESRMKIRPYRTKAKWKLKLSDEIISNNDHEILLFLFHLFLSFCCCLACVGRYEVGATCKNLKYRKHWNSEELQSICGHW